jgi:membrane protein implicated in regulation of membrane protease activity
MCLLCLETGRPPWLTLVAGVVGVLVVPATRIIPLSPDGQAALFTAVAVPALAALAWRAYLPRGKPPAQRPLLPTVAFRLRNTYTATRQPIAVATHK